MRRFSLTLLIVFTMAATCRAGIFFHRGGSQSGGCGGGCAPGYGGFYPGYAPAMYAPYAPAAYAPYYQAPMYAYPAVQMTLPPAPISYSTTPISSSAFASPQTPTKATPPVPSPNADQADTGLRPPIRPEPTSSIVPLPAPPRSIFGDDDPK